jgi:hypothetical protein
VVIDIYRFYLYYLTPVNSHPLLGGGGGYRLVEWQSIQYADYNEIYDIADSTLQANVVKWLATAGKLCPTNSAYALSLGYDPTQETFSSAFYNLNASLSSATVNSITEAAVTVLTSGNSGILTGGFGYGVCPNSSVWGSAPVSVPEFGVASGNFPGGFEVGISGTGAGKTVMLRQLLVAKGAAPKIIWNDQSFVTNVRDTW